MLSQQAQFLEEKVTQFVESVQRRNRRETLVTYILIVIFAATKSGCHWVEAIYSQIRAFYVPSGSISRAVEASPNSSGSYDQVRLAVVSSASLPGACCLSSGRL
jgi:hypothetical protein